MQTRQRIYNVESDTEGDEYITYTKKDKSRTNSYYYVSILAMGLAIGSIGLASQTYNDYKELKHDYNTVISNLTGNQFSHKLQSKMLMVDSAVRNMVSGHPSCYDDYEHCMNLAHISSHMASHNGTISDIINGVYSFGNTDVFLLSPNNDIIAHGPVFESVNFEDNKIHLPPPNECEHYSYGTCIFTHNNTLMTYTHVYLNEQFDDTIIRRSADDFFSYGASGAGMGSAIGGGIGALAGPEGIPVGAAIGGAVGAIVGATVGAFQ